MPSYNNSNNNNACRSNDEYDPSPYSIPYHNQLQRQHCEQQQQQQFTNTILPLPYSPHWCQNSQLYSQSPWNANALSWTSTSSVPYYNAHWSTTPPPPHPSPLSSSSSYSSSYMTSSQQNQPKQNVAPLLSPDEVLPPPRRRISPTSIGNQAHTQDLNNHNSSYGSGSGCGSGRMNFNKMPLGVAECLGCGTMSSPEWRKGPSGKKELCNACGLRYARLQMKVSGWCGVLTGRGRPRGGGRRRRQHVS